jgi:ribosomal-protein-alanine N-acetyltransferase
VKKYIIMNQSYLFKTERLGFRLVAEGDFDCLLMLSTADPETWSSDSAEIDERIKNDIKHFSEKGYGAFLVFDIESGEFIGRAGFGDIQNDEIEVGYVVLEKYRGKGYATEMLKALLLWAKGHINKNRILSITDVHHAASERIMQKAGMIFSKKDKIDGIDSVIYEYKL